ncbi:MAG: ubiquinone/menaquinone biosynthesis methyltransferase [Planctomycetota bacterium]
MPAAARVRAMFDRIAPRYDLLNHVLSLGIDRGWRRRTARLLRDAGCGRVLDVCCGTGDSTVVLASHGMRAHGVDFAGAMLARARTKEGASRLVRGDALRLPFRDAAFDATTIAFGLRNLEDRVDGLREMARVTRPGGIVAVLECSLPARGPWRSVYVGYMTRVLPVVGGVVSGDREAYRYLPDTVLAWPSPDELEEDMRRAGLVEARHEVLGLGAAALHVGRVGEAATS